MRATDLHPLAYDLRNSVRPIDLLAAALGYGLMLAGFVGGVTMLVDWLQGNPQTVLPQLVALLEWIDGGVR